MTPCQGGEKAVLRVLDAAQIRWDLESLILSRPVALLVKELFLSHSGLLLVCGPTGAGKTTTLYAGLEALWNDSHALNIVTAEDPVEYQLDYATQIGVNRAVGLDFARVLRTILRQDPDVIMVGEIRDPETAKIAIQASLTGHLVMTTLHTNTAAAAVTRLVDIGVERIPQRLADRFPVGHHHRLHGRKPLLSKPFSDNRPTLIVILAG